MVTFKTFFKSEEAFTLATLLSSEGIDAVVIDDSSFGGNLLGTTTNAIRIEVPEDQLDSAKMIVESLPAVPADSVSETVTKRRGKRNRIFDTLIVVDLVFLAAVDIVPGVFHATVPAEVENYLVGLGLSEDLWRLAHETYRGFTVVCILSSVLVLSRMKLGRLLYVGTLIWGALLFLFEPPWIQTPLGGTLIVTWNFLNGAIVAMMFLPPVRDEFRKRLTDS